MLSDAFVQPRLPLESALTDLYALTAETGTVPPEGSSLKSLLEPLRAPCFFTVAGLAGSGKSTLLAALFGAPVFALTPPAAAAAHRGGKAEKRSGEKGGITEVTHVGAFPTDFHPAEWSVGHAPKSVTKEWLTKSEAILFCLPATHPWDRAAWEWLDSLPAEAWRKLMIVLTFADLRTPGELDAMAEHARGLCQAKHGAAPPLCAVSSTLGLLARTSAKDPQTVLAGSGLPELEAALLKVLRENTKRSSAVENAKQAGRGLCERVRASLLEAGRACEGRAAEQREKTVAARAALEAELGAAVFLGESAAARWRELAAAAVARLTAPAVSGLEERCANSLVAWLDDQAAAPGCASAARRGIASAGWTDTARTRLASLRRTSWFFASLVWLAALGFSAALLAGAPMTRALVPALVVALPVLVLGWLTPRREILDLAEELKARADAAAPGIARQVTEAAAAHARARAEVACEIPAPAGETDAAALTRRQAALETIVRELRG